jgi:hypothetical protein
VYHYRQLEDTLTYIYIYVLLNNNVVIKQKIHEDDRMAAKTQLMIHTAKHNDCILQICLWQTKRQRRVNNSVSNGCSFGPGRFYSSAWQRPYPIIKQQFLSEPSL